jgi:hypothetical protein
MIRRPGLRLTARATRASGVRSAPRRGGPGRLAGGMRPRTGQGPGGPEQRRHRIHRRSGAGPGVGGCIQAGHAGRARSGGGLRPDHPCRGGPGSVRPGAAQLRLPRCPAQGAHRRKHSWTMIPAQRTSPTGPSPDRASSWGMSPSRAWTGCAKTGCAVGQESARSRPAEPYSPSLVEDARNALLASGALAWARLTPADAPDAEDRLPLMLEVAERPRRRQREPGRPRPGGRDRRCGTRKALLEPTARSIGSNNGRFRQLKGISKNAFPGIFLVGASLRRAGTPIIRGALNRLIAAIDTGIRPPR